MGKVASEIKDAQPLASFFSKPQQQEVAHISLSWKVFGYRVREVRAVRIANFPWLRYRFINFCSVTGKRLFFREVNF
jgi:hypothetical protein